MDTKKKTFCYQEASEEKRQEFLNDLEKIPEEERVWLDETGIDDNEIYAYGRSPKGERCLAQCLGKKSERISIVAALNQEKLMAPCYFEGTMNTKFFEEWLEKMLLPELPENCTIIMDNASFHKSAKIRELIEKSGKKLLYLPPYSPQDNEIEHRWFPLKNQIRKILQTFQNLQYAVESVLLNTSATFS